MRKPATSARAVAILAAAAVAAFAVSTAAVSMATTSQATGVAAFKFPFAKFTYTASVSTARPLKPSTFTLTFLGGFTLGAHSPGIVTSGHLDNMTVTEQVAYPVPGGEFVGPLRLPFKSETLDLAVNLKGTCFVSSPNGYVFRNSPGCVTSTLKLGSKTFKVSALLVTCDGSVFPAATGAGGQWTATLGATFRNPGYTFPVATLGSGGSTALAIGANGGQLGTKSIVFTG